MGYIYTRDSLLMVVCDGLGGHARGELASNWVLETLAHRFQQNAKPIIENPKIFLEACIMAAHSRIIKLASLQNMPETPRTTVVAAIVQQGLLWVAHSGDSRCYHFRDGHVVWRTRDHSKVQHLIDTGKITSAAAAMNHPERNRLINCVGAEVPPIVEHALPVPLQENDTILMCSDGVWGVVNDADMCLLLKQPDISQTVPQLVERAHIAGGPAADDATALAMRWQDQTPPSASIDAIDTTEIEDSAFLSTISLTLIDPASAPEMSDEEMDAEVQKINETIARMRESAEKLGLNRP
jgi:PPM family protein phosphatase